MAAKAAAAVTFDGPVLVTDSMKMSYSVNGIMNYGESYKLEYSSDERLAAIEAGKDDPSVDVPAAILISASFDTTDGGPTKLAQGKKYQLTITEIAE